MAPFSGVPISKSLRPASPFQLQDPFHLSLTEIYTNINDNRRQSTTSNLHTASSTLFTPSEARFWKRASHADRIAGEKQRAYDDLQPPIQNTGDKQHYYPRESTKGPKSSWTPEGGISVIYFLIFASKASHFRWQQRYPP